ncbi:ABC transporter permease [Proteiniclasticum sp. QWL-01]|uniref:ABC transporter permease subunit n=1 Tax=Proteiniclasticum sp. QWL-01 TaxID=3036945 RepID=UPI00240FD522|nr:ABC transporter permease [Proteiniclasticum sp. QWL-01]WFF72519.1 ABC transporter permease [Proteiniclasticum sp. QWL-01]
MKSNRFQKGLMSVAVPALFLIISALAIKPSGLPVEYIAEQVMIRMVRNSFLVLALLLPIMAGMGINFALSLGAMAGQIGLITVQGLGMKGPEALFAAILISVPVALLLGIFAGQVLNRAKGREMITSMMLAFLINGVYQFVILYIFGSSILPFNANRSIILSKGVGVRNTLELTSSQAFDKLGDSFLTNLLGSPLYIGNFKIPFFTILLIVLLCLFTLWITRTKLGQDMRAVGQDMEVAANSGINVDRTRLWAISISTILAGIGQIIYLQNLGTMNTYTGHESSALYSAASLLIGGASVASAGILNAILGTGLFHTLFVLMPPAATTLTGNSMIGEYSRMVISYGIVALALVMHARRKIREKELDRQAFRGQGTPVAPKKAEG